MLMGAGKMNQSVKQLSYQHEDLCSTLAPGEKKKQKTEPSSTLLIPAGEEETAESLELDG